MIHVCFVDDDALLLAGVKRTMRRIAPSISLTVAASGAEALALLGAHPCDVLISDLHMPLMNGQTLMAEVQSRFPDVARVVATGDVDPCRAFDLQLVSHRIVEKPVEMKTLVALVEQLHAVGRASGSAKTGTGSLHVQWASLAAQRLSQQRVSSISAEVARGNPWLAMLLLQATNGGFVASRKTLSVEAAACALGPAHLSIMFDRLTEIVAGLPHGNLTACESSCSASCSASYSEAELGQLLDLARGSAQCIAPLYAERARNGENTQDALDAQDAQGSGLAQHASPVLTEAQFLEVAESAALLLAASPATPEPDDDAAIGTAGGIAIGVANDAARLGVPLAIVEAVCTSRSDTSSNETSVGAALRLAVARLGAARHAQSIQT